MKEHPILFTAPMVRAILDGSKTQTRRPLYTLQKMRPTAMFHRDYRPPFVLPAINRAWALGHWYKAKPGDRLWVRETWAKCGDTQHVIYKADEPCALGAYGCVRWTPSIHMPRLVSRITLDVTAVRIERLQAISERDATAEGCGSPFTRDCKVPKFAALWESINGAGSWDANPWVVVIEFKRA